MDGPAMEKVIDKIAEKVGMTADALQPIAEETVRQVSVRGLVQAISCGITAVLLLGMIYVGYRLLCKGLQPDTKHCDEGVWLTAGIACCACGVLGAPYAIAFTIMGLMTYIAPLPAILGS